MTSSFAPLATKLPFLDLRAAYAELGPEIDSAVTRVTSSGWYLIGPELEAFEAAFAEYVGTRYCIGVANGLDALTLVLRAWGVAAGDEVIVPSNTYVATWLAVSAVGATIVPVEPDPQTMVITSAAVQAALTPRTRVVLPVHLYGLAADLSALEAACRARGIRILEDAAQAHGASVDGRRAGALGDAGAWSFYPTKNLGALGDAGAVTTNDPDLADRLRVLRNYGSRVKYVNEVLGTNSRLDELQAAVLRVKLSRLDEWNARRAAVAERYTAGLSDSGLVLPVTPHGRANVWHQYTVRSPRRDALRARLGELGIETLVHYPVPPHLQQAYGHLGWGPESFPVSERIHREIVSLPMGPHLSAEQADRVVEAVRIACSQC